ncbi:methionine aminopeptidase 2-like protein [Aspergillus recurvatus]
MTISPPELPQKVKDSGAGANGADTPVPAPAAADGALKEAEDSADDAAETTPSILLSQLFPNNTYARGEEIEYRDENRYRTTSEEKRYLGILNSDFLSDYRQEPEAHRQVRQWARRSIRPGQTLLEIANGIEDCARRLKNVLKADIGIHAGGRIVDSAFTMAFDPTYDNLLAAAKDATNTVGELGGYIQEVMESFECESNGKTHPIKAIRNLCGHTIPPRDVFAIETFGSTGSGRYVEGGEIAHYALRGDANRRDLTLSSARSVLIAIKKNFSTILFCRRYLDRIGQEKYLLGLNYLVKSGILADYPPLNEKQGTYTAQFEHITANGGYKSILLRPNAKEVISRGDDY